MSKALRWSEKWFQRGLWVVALVFAGFLIALGNAVVSDLPRIERAASLDDHMPPGQKARLEAAQEQAAQQAQEAEDALEQARMKLGVAASDLASARASFQSWVAARRATERADQDPEVLSRTRAVDQLQAQERQARAEVERQQQLLLNARQAGEQARRDMQALENEARQAYTRAQRAQELRVFGYRLALTLPLLLAAGWLFKRHRQSRWWPFVWGFIFFALFVFFVELAPYLPSYGGYVRYLVGIAITVLAGRWAILGLQNYLERQRAAEAQSDQQRRQALSYDTALTRMSKNVCPGCERGLNLADPALDYCPHCGMCLFNHCGHCSTRKNAFTRFCHACGTAATPPGAPQVPPAQPVPAQPAHAQPASGGS